MWKQQKLEAQLREVSAIKDHVVISGGLAWHLMSPPHEECKQVHDHSDVDLFVYPDKFNEVAQTIKSRGFHKYWTKFWTPNFYRYGYAAFERGKRVKVLYDLFLREVPHIEVKGFKVAEPKFLLSLYGDIHMSSGSYAVRAAKILVARGISPVGRKELLEEPKDN